MLPVERRVRRRDDFAVAVRHGRRVGAAGLVVHVATDTGSHPARAGFVVGRAVGSAVTRNRVRRQLRHLVAPRLDELPAGTDLVIRALPAAAQQTGRELAATMGSLIDRACRVSA